MIITWCIGHHKAILICCSSLSCTTAKNVGVTLVHNSSQSQRRILSHVPIYVKVAYTLPAYSSECIEHRTSCVSRIWWKKCVLCRPILYRCHSSYFWDPPSYMFVWKISKCVTILANYCHVGYLLRF